MKIYRIRDQEEYQRHARLMQVEYSAWREFEMALLPKLRRTFRVKGFSYPAGQTVRFHVNYELQNKEGGPNWRESMVCPVTHLNNRMRASVHLFEFECGPYDRSRIYISEQVAPMFRYFSKHYRGVTGSEYLGKAFPPGASNNDGIRNEDLTDLSFEDGSFDYFLSFDCFEHIPDYLKAFREGYRILAPGGTMLFSVPFVMQSRENVLRARISTEGTVEHLMEPEYHGDPINTEGCLCFQYFGWEMLKDLTSSGFRDAYALLYWSKDFGYLGGEQIIFLARK